MDAERRQKEVVVGRRAHRDAKEVAIGADDEAAALELPCKRPGLRRPNDHEVRVRRRRVESGREESGADALPLRRRRAELRLDLGPLERRRGERGRARRDRRGRAACAQLRSEARRGDAVADAQPGEAEHLRQRPDADEVVEPYS